MENFWSKEWKLFIADMQELGEILMQPVTWGKQNKELMLKPTEQEINEKAETSSFWAKEKELMKKDFQELGEFFMQPVTFR